MASNPRVPRTPSLITCVEYFILPFFFRRRPSMLIRAYPRINHLLFPAADPSPHRNRSHAYKKRYRPGARLADAGGVVRRAPAPSCPRASCAIVRENRRLCFAASRLGGRENGRPCASLFASFIFSSSLCDTASSAGMNRFDTIKGKTKERGAGQARNQGPVF